MSETNIVSPTTEGSDVERIVMRCDVTKNPCGTDTRPVGMPCLCKTCAQYLLNNQEPLGDDFQKVIDDNYWELITGA